MYDVDFGFYKNNYFGDIVPEISWKKYERKARIHLDLFTFNRIKEKELSEEVKLCICEIAEFLYDEETKVDGKGITSESTDGHSVTFDKRKTEDEIQRKAFNITRKYLAYTGLMYTGATLC